MPKMTTPITINIPHQLGRAEARRRIETGWASMLRQLPVSGGGRSEHWDGDRLTFSVAGLGQKISGAVDVMDTSVTLTIELPGILGALAGALKTRLQREAQLLLTRK